MAFFQNAFGKAVDWLSKSDPQLPQPTVTPPTKTPAAATAEMLEWLKQPDDQTLGSKFREFMANNVDINGTDEEGNTGLHLGTALDRPWQIAQFFIGQGAKLNVQNQAGWTPLMYAAAEGKSEIADMLIQAGADISPRNRDGNDALDVCNDADIGKKIAERKAQAEDKPEPVMVLDKPLTAMKPLKLSHKSTKLNA